MQEKILPNKLIECFETIKNNFFEGFSGFLEMNKNSFLIDIEKNISNENQEIKDVFSSLINSQEKIHLIFFMKMETQIITLFMFHFNFDNSRYILYFK